MFFGRLYMRSDPRSGPTFGPGRKIAYGKKPIRGQGARCTLTPDPWTLVPGPLLDLDLRAGLFELLLDGRGFVLVHAFLDWLGRGLDEVLGFLQAEAGDFTDDLDDVDL